MRIQSYRDLDAWQLAMQFAIDTYGITSGFPRNELYGLTSQLRRAAIAIPSNIAEGHQQGAKAYAHYVVVALGSLAEAETQLELAKRLRFVAEQDATSLQELANRTRQLLHGLKRSLK
jgi:four helix bundle protein